MERGHASGTIERAAVSAVRLATRLLSCPAAGVGLADGDRIRVVAWHGVSDEFVARFNAVGGAGVASAVVSAGKPYRLNDTAKVTHGLNPAAVAEGLRATLAVPLLADGEVVGVFYVGDYRPHEFSDQDELLLTMLAEETMVGVDSAQQLDAERRARRQAEALLEVARAASSGDSVQRVLARVAAVAARYGVAERCSILLHKQAGELDSFVSMFADGEPRPDLWQTYASMPPIRAADFRGLADALRGRQPVYEGDVPNSEIVPRAWSEAYEIKSVIIYPMVVRDRAVGVMALDSFSAPFPYPDDEIEMMQALAGQAAMAVEQVRLRLRILEQAEVDPLTKLPNRYTAQAWLSQAFDQAREAGRTFSVLIADVDNMCVINDGYGNRTGDLALSRIAEIVRAVTPPGSFGARWSGDEFLIAFPGGDSQAARAAGRRILQEAARRALHVGPGHEVVPLYLSMGVAQDDGCPDADALLVRARRALNEAKLGGGDAVVGDGEDRRSPPAEVRGLIQALSLKPTGGQGEARQVAHYALLIADGLGLPLPDRHALRTAAFLHDIGNLVVPDEVLAKPGPLTVAEGEQVREHVDVTERILRGSERLSDAFEAAGASHERWDGSGYPRSLKGADIPRMGRILAVADAYVSMRSERPYRPAKGHSEAMAELRAGSGSQFDPEVVRAFVRALDTEASRVA